MQQKSKWLERPIHPALPAITIEVLIFSIIILLALASRFYNLGARVMSHDESLHTYFSWLLYRGQGYQHTPMMHGPWQFHFIALSYFLFGVSDFTARIPAALFSIASIWMVWYWRHFLGKIGALFAGVMMVISPYLLFYGRYVREDSYAVFAGILMLYAVLRYFETGSSRYLFLFTSALVIHFLDKETSYIFAAQLLIFLAVYFVARVLSRPWTDKQNYHTVFVVLLIIGAVLLLALGIFATVGRGGFTMSSTETVVPANPNQTGVSPLTPIGSATLPLMIILGILAAGIFIAAFVILIKGYGWQSILSERSFDLLIVTGSLVLPLLTPLVLKLAENWIKVSIPTDGPSVQNLTPSEILTIAIFLAIMFAISIAIGWIWKRQLWWKVALTFWVPYTVLYTSFFTNSDGFFTGTLGSLGYWLVQQGVQRGSQPWYYYILVQIPVYEFLPALGFILALFLGLRRSRPAIVMEAAAAEAGYMPTEEETQTQSQPGSLGDEERTTTERLAPPEILPANPPADGTPPPISAAYQAGDPQADPNFLTTFSLLAWWSIASVLTLSIAGERMPWLTVHLTWPMILLTGWALGRLVNTTDWEALRQHKVLLTLVTVVIFVAGLANAMLNFTLNPPFQGKDLAQLQATSAFLLPAIVAAASAVGLFYLLRGWNLSQVGRIFLLTVFGFLFIFTGRAAFRAAYIDYDRATEFLVYAHGATGIKQVMAQAREISERTAGGLNVAIAYDASAPDTGVSWPFVWYLRDYTNQRSFDAPTRSLRDSVLVIVDAKNFDKIEAALGPNFYRIDYIRMWWPMQDYFGLTSSRDPKLPLDPNYPCRGILGVLRIFKSTDFSRICNALTNPEIRAGIVDIWWNRDYTRYAQALGRNDLTLSTWQPSDQMRLYIRKDVAAQIWNYGVGPAASPQEQDPTQGKTIELAADLVIDSSQLEAPGLNSPRALAFAKDGSFFVADSMNHRILHFDSQGNLIKAWGSFAQGTDEVPALPGTFNEPWGVAVGPDGAVYVTDTWNHRVQKFTADGVPLLQWGHFGQADSLDAFYGPRGIAVDADGRVFVADTGNKRVVVFDSDGNPITQIGSGGFEPGQFDEPVGVAIDSSGRLYVADTWNQRIQTFIRTADGSSYMPDRQWDVYGWFGQSLENKPFIAVDGLGRVYITDPDGYRIMEFSNTGELQKVWGDYGTSSSSFSLPSGVAVDPQGHVWVTDAGSQRILRFTVP